MEGIKAFKNKNHDMALRKYSEAIDRDGSYSVSYANRSAVWTERGQLEAAANDAENVSMT